MKSIPQSRFTYDHEHDTGKEVNKEPSSTTPDMTLPLKELLNRFSRGQAVPSFDTSFDAEGEEDLPDLSKLSPMEIVEMRKNVADEIAYQRELASNRKPTSSPKTPKTTKESKKPEDAIVVPPTPPSSEG